LWAAKVNLSGLYSSVPQRMVQYKDLDGWWAADGNFTVSAKGPTKGSGWVCFAHSNRAVVAAWILGVRASMKMLREWAGDED